jgi:hypothetical protein
MSRILLVCLLFAAACVVNNDPGGDDAPPPGIELTPRVGTWYYAETTPVSNNCGYQIGASVGDFSISAVTGSSFQVDPDDGTAPFTCSLSGSGDYLCPDRAAKTADLHPGFDAVITMHAVASGTFSADTRASGQQTATVSCAGLSCSGLGTWPCTFKVDYVVAAR